MADQSLTIFYHIWFNSLPIWWNSFLMWSDGDYADIANIFLKILVDNIYFVTEVYSRACINIKTVRFVEKTSYDAHK